MGKPLPTQCRREVRHYPPNLHVGWRERSGEPPHRARVVDESCSGVGLRMDDGAAPPLGGTLLIMSRVEPQFRTARVVRVTNPSGSSVHIGARWITARSHATINRPAHHRRRPA